MTHSSRGFRRRSFAAILALTLTGGLAACGGDSTGNGAVDPDAMLRVVLPGEPATLDPIVGARDAADVWATVLEPLVSQDEEHVPTQDGIVQDWERVDERTWRLDVRTGIEFTNGEPADSDAVAQSILLNRDTTGAILAGYFANVESAEAVDESTVEIVTVRPQFNIIDLLTEVYLIPPAYYAEQGTEGFTAAPIGTGPFVWDGRDAGSQIRVVRNDDYHGEVPQIGGVTFSWAPTGSQRASLLQSGQVDLAMDVPHDQALTLEAADFDVERQDSALKMTLFLESGRGPLADPELREAIALAVDRDGIIEGIFDGNAQADYGLLNVLAHQDPTVGVDQDVERARSLVTGNPEITFTYPADRFTNVDTVAQAVGGSLEEIGFDVTYNAVDYGSLVGVLLGREIDGLYLMGSMANVPVPDFFVKGFVTSTSITGNCPHPDLDQMAAEALEQTDEAAAQDIYEAIDAIVIEQEHCFVPLYRPQYNFATGPNVHGVFHDDLSRLLLHDVTITE